MMAIRSDFLVVVSALLLALPASAGGLYVAEFATTDMGAAGSGILAGSSKGSALLNPAAMTLRDSHTLNMGLAPGASVVRFDQDETTPVAGNNGGNQGGFIPLLSSSYVHKVSDRIRAGVGAFSVSGASLDPKSDWAGRNQVTNIQLFSLSLFTSVGIKLTDWLSIGAGPLVTYATLDWKLKAPLPGPGNNEADVKLDDMDDWAVAAVVGLLIEPMDDIRVGLQYQSKTNLTLSGDTDFGGLANVNTKLKLPLPHAIRGDIRWQATNDVAFSVGGGWENWSELKDTRLTLGDARSNIRLGFKDTYKLRGGVHYQLNEKWMVQTGVSFDSSALRTADRTPALPIDKQWRWGIGATYDWDEGTTVGCAFQYTNLGEAKVENAALKGKYKNNEIFFLVMTLSFDELPWDGSLSF